MYTETELKALEAADKAFAEVRKVALEFARQTGLTYWRNVTDWTCASYFNTSFGDDSKKRFNKVNNLYDGWNNEAQECAWAIEAMWNEWIGIERSSYETALTNYVMAKEAGERLFADYYDRCIDAHLESHRALRDGIGRIVESWYDSAAECAYNEFLEGVE